MPYLTATIRQAKNITEASTASPITRTFDSAVLAGSTLVFIGSALNGVSDQAALLGTPSGGGTWTTPDNTRASSDFVPNVCGSYIENVSAGSPTISLPFTSGGTAVSSGLRVSGTLYELIDVVVSGVRDKGPLSGTSSGGSTSTSTAASGTLSQTHNIVLMCGGGWFAIPTAPASPWTTNLQQQNGGNIGCLTANRVTTATTSITGTVSHEASAAASAIMYVFKAKDDVALVYSFDFPASGTDSLPSGETGIEAKIARNFEPMSATNTFEYYSGLTAEVGTKPGDSSTRRLRITSGLPAGINVSDTLRGSFRKSGGTTTGSVAWIAGAVEAA